MPNSPISDFAPRPSHLPASQCARILAHLQARPGEWVPMPDLWQASGAFAVHSRINDLRRQGYHIDHKNERTPDRAIHSYYRLQIDRVGTACPSGPSGSSASPSTSPSDREPSLFPLFPPVQKNP